MALSANQEAYPSRTKEIQSWQVQNTAEVYAYGYAGVGTVSHATAASRGRLQAFNDAVSVAPLGFATTRETGDTAATPIPTGKVAIDGGIFRVNVTGAGAVSNSGLRYVYATDDNTFTLTRPTTGVPLGAVVQYSGSGTACWVLFFSLETLIAIGAGGNAQSEIVLGLVSFASGISNGNQITGWNAPFHGEILNFYSHTVEICQGASSPTVVLNLEIGGTDVTGGAMTVNGTSNDAVGERNTATTITAANFFHEGDQIDVEAASASGTFTGGLIVLIIEVLKHPGA